MMRLDNPVLFLATANAERARALYERILGLAFVADERLQLNENNLTSHEPGYRTLPLDVRKDFATVTNLIAQRRFAEADALVTEKWLGLNTDCSAPFPRPGACGLRPGRRSRRVSHQCCPGGTDKCAA